MTARSCSGLSAVPIVNLAKWSMAHAKPLRDRSDYQIPNPIIAALIWRDGIAQEGRGRRGDPLSASLRLSRR
jgi:hypothetical protein